MIAMLQCPCAWQASGIAILMSGVANGGSGPLLCIQVHSKLGRAPQPARGHQPRTREEIDAYIRAERDGWDD